MPSWSSRLPRQPDKTRSAMSFTRSHARLPATVEIEVFDEYGESRRQAIAAERPLTVYLNRREIVTLMTLGDDPEALVVGYLRNQGLLSTAADLRSEERRVGNECRCRWSPCQGKNK